MICYDLTYRQTYNISRVMYSVHAELGWGLLNQFTPFRYFLNLSAFSKQPLAIEYHVYIWQLSPQLSCGDTSQIWMRFKEYITSTFARSKILLTTKLRNGALVTLLRVSCATPTALSQYANTWWTTGRHQKFNPAWFSPIKSHVKIHDR